MIKIQHLYDGSSKSTFSFYAKKFNKSSYVNNGSAKSCRKVLKRGLVEATGSTCKQTKDRWSEKGKIWKELTKENTNKETYLETAEKRFIRLNVKQRKIDLQMLLKRNIEM